MKVKILEDFDCSLDGIRTTSFKKGDVVSSFNTKEVQKFVKRELIAIEKSGIPKQNTGKSAEQIAEEKEATEKAEKEATEKAEKEATEKAEKAEKEATEKSGKQNPPAQPQANRDGKDQTGDSNQ